MIKSSNTPDAQIIPIEVVGSSTFGRYAKINSQKTYNMFISDGWLVPFAGYKRVLDLVSPNAGEGRGLFNSVRGGFMLAVVGQNVYRISTTLGIQKLVNSLSTSSGEVSIDENLGGQICIVDGFDAYIYNHLEAGVPTLTAQGITAGRSSLIPNYVEYHNTRFLIGNGIKNGNGALWSVWVKGTATTISFLSELTLQTKPDFAIAMQRLPGQANNIIVFGRSVCEIWTQVDNVFIYRRNSTVSVDTGCVSVSTIASSDKNVFWLGTNETNAPVLMSYNEKGAQSISTDGIDHQLQGVTRPDKSTALIYRQDGHLFYQLTFFDPADDFTLVYDVGLGVFYNLSDHKLRYQPARQQVFFNKKWYFISLDKASIYETSTDFTTIDESLGENADDASDFIFEMQRIRICNTVRADNSQRFRPNSFTMTLEQGNDPDCTGLREVVTIITEDTGVDIITESGQAIIMENSISSLATLYCPRIDLSFSKNGGVTWSNTVSRRLQPLAHRQNILSWYNMGAANDFTIKLRFWGTSRFLVNNGVLEIY